MGDGSGQALGVVNQTQTENYTYDEIGNLISDAQDNIRIEWTVYGKVKTVTKTDGSQTIDYLYDASGNRTAKTVRTVNAQTGVAIVLSTYYVRDAQGNVLSVYDNNNTARTIRQSELHLYGSSRLGLFKPNGNRPAVATNGIYTRRLGRKEYELTDHLGNVRAVVGDYRQTDGVNPVRAALRSYFNHYAFGLEMPGMVWKGGGYRYGYNGKEQDADFANNYDYGFRIYNPGVGRFLSVDPLSAEYPWNSTYAFAENRPVDAVDLDGAELYFFDVAWNKRTGQTVPKIITSHDNFAINFTVKNKFGSVLHSEKVKQVFSDYGLSANFVQYGVNWVRVPDAYDLHKLPDQEATDWDTFETYDEFEQRMKDAVEQASALSGAASSVVRGAAGMVAKGSKQLGYFKHLQGKTVKTIEAQAKKMGWKRQSNRTGEGWNYVDGNGKERVRFRYVKGDKAKFRHEEKGYIRWTNEKGQDLDIDGKVHIDPRKTPEYRTMTEAQREAAENAFKEKIHISLEQLNGGTK